MKHRFKFFCQIYLKKQHPIKIFNVSCVIYVVLEKVRDKLLILVLVQTNYNDILLLK